MLYTIYFTASVAVGYTSCERFYNNWLSNMQLCRKLLKLLNYQTKVDCYYIILLFKFVRFHAVSRQNF